MSLRISFLKTRANSKRLHLRLRSSAEAQVRSGHPWVFSESIREQNREATQGELAIIFDKNDQFLAAGFYDPESPIRVRIVHTGKPATIHADWWSGRLQAAIKARAGIFDSETNAGRLINGESDQFPALVLDRYADTFVLKLYSGIWFSHLATIVSLISEEFSLRRLVLRLSRNIQASAAAHSLRDGQILFGAEAVEPVQFLESGLCFEADVLKGQKTGFFLDQRENRRLVESFSKGEDVLNAFSFAGGFSLYAARGGARSVTDIDISAHALESSRRNFALNPAVGRAVEHHHLIQADVFEWLAMRHPERYGVVILDPPSLARREAERANALRAYAKLAEAGGTLTREGGVLLCCSCSAHVRADEFLQAVTTGLQRTGRPFQIFCQTGEPIDHRATFAEAQYLKAAYLRVQAPKP